MINNESVSRLFDEIQQAIWTAQDTIDDLVKLIAKLENELDKMEEKLGLGGGGD